MSWLQRVDRYTVIINGRRIHADFVQEIRIRMMSTDERARFLAAEVDCG